MFKKWRLKRAKKRHINAKLAIKLKSIDKEKNDLICACWGYPPWGYGKHFATKKAMAIEVAEKLIKEL